MLNLIEQLGEYEFVTALFQNHVAHLDFGAYFEGMSLSMEYRWWSRPMNEGGNLHSESLPGKILHVNLGVCGACSPGKVLNYT